MMGFRFILALVLFSAANAASSTSSTNQYTEEAARNVVEQCYLEILHRAPDRLGLEIHVAAMMRGEDRAWLECALKDSDEYRKIQSDARRQVVQFCFLVCLVAALPVLLIVSGLRAAMRGTSVSNGWRMKALLLVLSSLFSLVMAELICRVLAVAEDRRECLAMFRQRVHSDVAGDLKMGDVLRLTGDSIVYYELVPATNYQWLGKHVKINSAGMRGEERDLTKEGGVRRIVGIGDSVIWGWGVADDETYLALLERSLNAISGVKWQVFNMGVPGYNTAMEVRAFLQKGRALRPDLVILNYVANDFDPPPFYRPRRNCWDLRRSFLAEFAGVRCQLAKRFMTGRSLPYRPLDRRKELKHLSGWDPFESAITELVRQGKEDGFDILVVALEGHMPERVEMLLNGLGVKYFYPFDSYSQKTGVPCDINAYLKTELYLNPKDPHPSAVGHRYAAEELLCFMQANAFCGGISAD